MSMYAHIMCVYIYISSSTHSITDSIPNMTNIAKPDGAVEPINALVVVARNALNPKPQTPKP